MGDGADYLIEQMDWCGEDDTWYEPGPIRTLECKHCKSTAVKWKEIDKKWTLFDLDGNVHTCPGYEPPIEILKKILKQKQKNDTMEQLLPIPSWDHTFMHDVYWWARRSKDPRTKIGSVLVHWDSKDPISHAYNGFARKINDNVNERWERPEKYFWVSHAESNSILNCSRTGRSSKGTVMYTQGLPCADCANDIIQAGISEVVIHKQWQDYERKFGWEKWIESAKRSETKFKESGVKIRIFDGVVGMTGVLDGKIIDI